MSEISVLIYPWDIQYEGVQNVVDSVAALGVTRLVVATAYHSAEVIAPRRTTNVVTVAEANTSHLHLPPNTFSGLSLAHSSIANDDPDLFYRLKQATNAAGIGLDAWGVAFHNTSLATTHPEVSIMNCFGDRFTHGLCPASPAARIYAVELFAGIAGTGFFDRVLAESISYLLYSHGHPHELWGARLDVATRYLLSLCFCEYCTLAATSRDIDVEALRAKVAAELTRTWNEPFPAGRDPDDGNELTSLHFAWPELAAYTRMRLDITTSLVVEITNIVRAKGAAIDISAAVWGRPSHFNWLEGVDVRGTLAVADGFVLESYYVTASEVAREIDHTKAIAQLVGASAAQISVALPLWPSFHPTLDQFLAKVQTIKDAGIDSIALYNYGTATSMTLNWVERASQLMSDRTM
jgi:hypothetical protein